MKVNLERVESESLVSYLSDFSGDVQKWQGSFFELMSIMNTWGIIRDMYISDNRKGGVFIRVILNSRRNTERMIETMTGLGYGKIKAHDIIIGEVTVDDPDIEDVFLE